MAAPPATQFWSFDVSSLMVLIGEGEEQSFRLSRRSLAECLVPVPVAGLQNYVRSYDLLLEPGTMSYFSPYGCKTASLRNTQLSNAIRHAGLLEDHRYTVYHIPPSPSPIVAQRRQIRDASPSSSSSPSRLAIQKRRRRKYRALLHGWILAIWALYAGLLAFVFLVPDTTWISAANVVGLTLWSVLLRLVEYLHVRPAALSDAHITDPDGPDAVFVLGRGSSALVLEGDRRDVKALTSPGLVYRTHGRLRGLGIPAWGWQWFTRGGSLAALLFIFSSVPNGSTMDQVAFIVLNILAQMNVMVGQRLNASCCLEGLERVQEAETPTRTHVYARLIEQFRQVDQRKNWVDISGILPKTNVWDEWKRRIVHGEDRGKDPKALYNEISKEKEAEAAARDEKTNLGFANERQTFPRPERKAVPADRRRIPSDSSVSM